MLIENTNLCEKALLAEAAKDKIERKLNELTEQCNQTIENLNTSEKIDDEAQKTSVVDYLKEIKSRLEDLQSVNLKTNEELIDHEIKLSFVKEENDPDKVDEDVLLNEDQAVLEEEKRAMGQVSFINFQIDYEINPFLVLLSAFKSYCVLIAAKWARHKVSKKVVYIIHSHHSLHL